MDIEEQRAGLLKFAHSLCGDEDRAEDLVQESYLAYLERVNDIEHSTSWMRQAIKSKLINSRKNLKAGVQQLEDPNLVLELSANPLATELREMCLDLEADEREIVGYLSAGYSPPEVAEKIGKPLRTTERHISSTIRKLRQMNASRDSTDRPDAASIKNS